MPTYKDKSNNSWYVKLYYTDFSGQKRQKMKRGFALQREAKEWEHDFQSRYAGQPDITFRELARVYMSDRQASTKAISCAHIQTCLARIVPFFGDMPISDIKPTHINEWQKQVKDSTNNLTGKPLAASYMRTLKTRLSAMFNFAVKYYNLASNPCKNTENIFDKPKKHVDFWTVDDFNRFIATFDKQSEYYLVFNMLYYTGMRMGELLALTIKDIDLQKKSITINKTLSKVNGKKVITTPKTPRSNREIIIPSFLCDIIAAYIKRIYDPRPETILFALNHTSYDYAIKKHARMANLKVIRLHDLRHSHASLLIELGFSALLVSERLGHENVSTTLDIYSHLFPSKQSEVAEKLDQLQALK